ncbi:MAG: radical SAM protein [Candidatus Epulonipiscium fishelsonii]|nr:MAG: radical SAM protein [Epulopiscium sp. AS2M-Bin002]
MDRYNKITNKTKREIVLLKSFPCIWGKCTFCDYIEDNSNNLEEILTTNNNVLSNVTGEFGVLEVINSGSCFELPSQTLEKINRITKEKNIKKIFFESHWAYKDKLQEMRDSFKIPIVFKTGVETFDNDFRNKILNKNFNFDTWKELKQYFDSPCIMVGIQGQTQEMIKNDMQIIENHFDHATINIYTNNSTNIKRDETLVKWFIQSYQHLIDNPKYDVLINNTDFGVGD